MRMESIFSKVSVAGSHGQCISVRGLFSRQRSQFAAPALAGNHLICKEEPTDRKALSVATHSLSLTPHSTTLWVSGTLSPPRGLGAATWAAARPYREPRRWPVRVQPFPLRLRPGFFSGERRAADRKPGSLRYGLGNC